MNRVARPIARILVGGALLAFAAATAPRVRADDPRASLLEGRAYEKKETFVASGRTVEAYTAKPDEERGGLDLHRFLAVEGDDVTLALSASVEAVDGRTSRVSISWVRADVEAERVDVEIAKSPAADAYKTARRLAEDALAAWTTWTDASALLEKAVAEESPEARRPMALAATRALDRAFASHPDHAGVLHDLLAAYELLLPLEAGTDRGANVSFLWRDRLRILKTRFEPTDEAFAEVVQRAFASCGLAEGCYALAFVGATFRTTLGESFGEDVRASLAALGQERQETVGNETFGTRRGDVGVITFRCPADPPDGGIPFHRLTCLTVGPGAVPIPTPVWYSLTDEREGERHRWALYGNVGGSRRLLRLYGPTEPDTAEAKQAILDAIRASLETAAGR